jgi:hypothetical protein
MYQAINQRHLDRLREGVGDIEHNNMSLIIRDVDSYISIPDLLTGKDLIVSFDNKGNISNTQINDTKEVLFDISEEDDIMFAEIGLNDSLDINNVKCFYVTCVDRVSKKVNLLRMDNGLLSDWLKEKIVLALSDTKNYRKAMLEGNRGNN